MDQAKQHTIKISLYHLYTNLQYDNVQRQQNLNAIFKLIYETFIVNNTLNDNVDDEFIQSVNNQSFFFFQFQEFCFSWQIYPNSCEKLQHSPTNWYFCTLHCNSCDACFQATYLIQEFQAINYTGNELRANEDGNGLTKMVNAEFNNK